MQNGQNVRVAALRKVIELFSIVEGVEIGEHRGGRERQREPQARGSARPTLPQEVNRQQRKDEETGVPEVQRRHFLVRAERNTEERRQLDGQRRNDGKAQDDEYLRA